MHQFLGTVLFGIGICDVGKEKITNCRFKSTNISFHDMLVSKKVFDIHYLAGIDFFCSVCNRQKRVEMSSQQ